jgi:hypothetical protein
MTDDQNQPEGQPWQENPGLSRPGEPAFAFGELEIAPGVKMVALVINAGGVQMQIVLRADLALNVARLLDEQAKRTRSGLVIAGNGNMPPVGDILGKGRG